MSVIKSAFGATTALVLGTLSAQAGGIERSGFNPGFLFEKGNWVELSFGSVSPSVSGTQAIPTGAPFPALPAGGSSGDMAPRYTTVAGALKFQLNDQWAIGVVVDQPLGADVDYGAATYLYGVGLGSTAEINSLGVTVLAHYRFDERTSVYGGIKSETVEGRVALFNGYTMNSSKEQDFGFVLGAAYEIPEIALRVALTYTSEIEHDFTAQEFLPAPGPGAITTNFTTVTPQSLALDFQTGIAENTLMFGSVKWRDWSNFAIRPTGFAGATGGSALVSYANDTITYTLGVGRRFSETWSGAVFVSHEASQGGFSGNLGPTDGYTSVGLGATYTQDNMKITGGVTYAMIGDAVTEAPSPAPAGTTFGRFTDNSLIGVGVKVGWSF